MPGPSAIQASSRSWRRSRSLCDPARHRPLVAFPRRVGVIAAYAAKGDVIAHLRKRCPPQDIAFCPAAVQGVEAVGSIIDALGRLQSVVDVDVIIIARGGGSVADLMPFDDERLCRAIATSRVPVVTSIGHTKDRPNCDHVSAAYVAVPAKAAELAIPHAASDLLDEFAHMRTGLDAVPGRVRERGDAVGELWGHVRPRQRLTELVDDVKAAAQLLTSRAEAGWRHATRTWSPPDETLMLLARALHVRGRLTTSASSCTPPAPRSSRATSKRLTSTPPRSTLPTDDSRRLLSLHGIPSRGPTAAAMPGATLCVHFGPGRHPGCPQAGR